MLIIINKQYYFIKFQLDEQDVLTKETLFAILDKIISDENDYINQAKELGSTCLEVNEIPKNLPF